jgi:Tfp pilus assembly protein PilF
MQAKRNDKAIDFLNKAISYQTNNNDNLLADMLVSLGDVYNTESRFASSDSCYRAALNLQPDNAMALNNFSYYLSVRGENLEEAARMSEKSLKLRPNEATFLDTYGWILYKQGKFKEAKTYIQKAIELSPNNGDPTLWEHLGDIEYKLGNKRQALEHWKAAVSKGETSITLQQKINEQKLND